MLMLNWPMQVLPEKEARAIASQICAGLAYLNEPPNRIIHYDLKPANVLFDKFGEVKITVRSSSLCSADNMLWEVFTVDWHRYGDTGIKCRRRGRLVSCLLRLRLWQPKQQHPHVSYSEVALPLTQGWFTVECLVNRRARV